MANAGANPLLVAQQSLAPHIQELEQEAEKLAARILEIQHELAMCRAMQLVAGVPKLAPDEPKPKSGARPSAGETPT